MVFGPLLIRQNKSFLVTLSNSSVHLSAHFVTFLLFLHRTFSAIDLYVPISFFENDILVEKMLSLSYYEVRSEPIYVQIGFYKLITDESQWLKIKHFRMT